MDHPNEDSIHIFLNSLANGSNISILFADWAEKMYITL
jgi:hypothetical protein